jgi:hypothetical protein
VTTTDIACDYPNEINAQARRAGRAFTATVEQAGLGMDDRTSVAGAANIVGAAALVYPRADEDTLLGASLWTAFLIMNDDRWDCSPPTAAAPKWFPELVRVLDGGVEPGADADPLARFLSITLDRLDRTLGPSAVAEIMAQIRTTLDAMVWERVWNRHPDTLSLDTYLSFRRAYSTMNVQVVLDKWINGGDAFDDLAGHPVQRAIDDIVVRFGCLSNDYYSWEREKRRADASNAVRILMDHDGLTEPAALDAVRRLCDDALRDLDCLATALATSDPTDPRTRRLVVYLNSHKPLIAAAARWPSRTDRYTVT